MANRAEQILKTIVTFDIAKDFEDKEAKENLANLFRELIMSDEDVVVEVLPKMIDSLSEILVELGVVEPKEDDSGEDKEETSPEEVAVENKKIKGNRLVERANDFIHD